jgi:hypothetical protein
MRFILGLLCACAGFVDFACARTDGDAKAQEGICIHSYVVTPRTGSCSGPTGSSVVYTFCSDENKSSDCKNLSAACTAGNLYDIDDTIIYYDGGKRCDANGYTVTCSNPKYKASTLAYCPP